MQPADVPCAVQLSTLLLQKVPVGSCPSLWYLPNCDWESLGRGLDGLNQNHARDRAGAGPCPGCDGCKSSAVAINPGCTEQRQPPADLPWA